MRAKWLAGALLPFLAAPLGAQAQPARRLQPHVAESKLYALYKPADWRVREEPRPDCFRILVQSPDGASTVDFFWAANNQNVNAIGFVGMYQRFLKQTHPDVSMSEVFASRDNARSLATVRFRSGQAAVKGRYYFEASPRGLSVQGYTAPEHRLAAERPLLLNIMASLAFGKSRGRAAPGGAPEAPPVQVALVTRRAQDGSMSVSIPADWEFLASGGKVATGAKDGGVGFVFTSLSGNPILRNATVAQGVIPTTYRPPAQALEIVLTGLNNRQVRVLSSTPDPATAQQYAAYTRSRGDAQDITARWTSPQGRNCLGAFKVINSFPSPTGLWYCLVGGIWGPENDFPRYLPMLEQVAGSFTINHQYARQYIQNGLENLRRLRARTADAMRDLNRAREQNQADWEARQARKDYMDSKWDDYRRGHSYWVSDLEGGKVYQTDSWGTRDTVTGDYYEGRGYNWVNFEGQNPRHPSENMREVSSYEIQQMQGR